MSERTFESDTQHSSGGARGEVATRVPALTILSHPDASRVGERAFLPDLVRAGATAALSRLDLQFTAPQGDHFRPLAHPYLSRKPLVLRRDEDLGMRLELARTSTKVRVDGADAAGTVVISAARLDHGVVLELGGRIVLLLHLASRPTTRVQPALGLLGGSGAMERLRDDILKVADTNVSVLLRGETGTGKELAARAIHAGSPRAGRPFVSINMGTIPPALAASELFGHERGAFSGAVKARQGYFGRANGGTLFLDEIGETPPEVQVALLRVLETGEVQPVGAERATRVDVRIIAATDADLDGAVASDAFRAPLLHRLSGYVIPIPPLRERREDVGLLFVDFLRAELAALGEADRLAPADGARPWLPAELVARLALHAWPGNVRELRNAARQIAIASRGADEARLGRYLDATLGTTGGAVTPAAAPVDGAPEPAPRRTGEITEDELIAALRANEFQVTPTAAALGLPKSTVYDMMARSGRIRKAKDISQAEVAEVRARVGDDLDAMAAALEVSARGLLLRMRELD